MAVLYVPDLTCTQGFDLTLTSVGSRDPVECHSQLENPPGKQFDGKGGVARDEASAPPACRLVTCHHRSRAKLSGLARRDQHLLAHNFLCLLQSNRFLCLFLVHCLHLQTLQLTVGLVSVNR